MSEEVALALANAAELARLRRWAARWKAAAKMMRTGWRDAYEAQQRTAWRWRARYTTVCDQRDEQQAELSACQHAAHMPADYAHGLPAWINKLYLCYIAVDDSPAQEERIECEVARTETDLRTQLVDAQTALRAAMEQAEATQRELMRLRGDDGHGKPYLNEM